MKRLKAFAVLLAAVLCLLALALAEADALDLYRGSWSDGTTTVSFFDRDGELACRITQIEGDESVVWEYSISWIEGASKDLCCADLMRCREHIDRDSLELVQTDWSLDDMAFAHFSLSGDGETLIGSDIEGMGGALTLRRRES